MPELPEVEMFRRYFDAHAVGRRVAKVIVHRERTIRGTPERLLHDNIEGRTFERTARRGKHVGAKVKGGGWVIFHFGMSGDFEHVAKGEPLPAFTRVEFVFDRGDRLAYTDGRVLGRVGWAEDWEEYLESAGLGPDVHEGFTRKVFDQAMQGRRGTIKALLMNQSVFAGLGNMYADEVIFQMRVSPNALVEKFTPATRAELFTTIKKIIQTLVRVKTDHGKLPKSWLTPHRHADQLCPRCHLKFKTQTLAGRTTYSCPKCQRRLK